MKRLVPVLLAAVFTATLLVGASGVGVASADNCSPPRHPALSRC